MASYSIGILSYDGLTPNPDYNFSPSNEQIITTQYQLIKYQNVNLWADKAYTIFKSNNSSLSNNSPAVNVYYLSSTGWQILGDSNTYVIPFNARLKFYIRVDSPPTIRVYMSMSEETDKQVPDQDKYDYITRQIVTPLTADIFTDYNNVQQASQKHMPVCDYLIYDNEITGSWRVWGCTLTTNSSNSGLDLHTRVLFVPGGTINEGTKNKSLEILEGIQVKGSTPEILADRVTALEQDNTANKAAISDLQTRMAEVEKTVGNLPAIVASINQINNQNYVAR